MMSDSLPQNLPVPSLLTLLGGLRAGCLCRLLEGLQSKCLHELGVAGVDLVVCHELAHAPLKVICAVRLTNLHDSHRCSTMVRFTSKLCYNYSSECCLTPQCFKCFTMSGNTQVQAGVRRVHIRTQISSSLQWQAQVRIQGGASLVRRSAEEAHFRHENMK